MSRHRKFIGTTIFAALAATMSAALFPTATQGSGMSILEKCWSRDQLAATEAELSILRGEAAKPYRAKPPGQLAAALPMPTPEAFSGLLLRVRPVGTKKRVALTFDLCEGGGERSGYDGRIVDFLRANGIPATFFMGGKWARNHETRALQLLADPLFEIGNHSFTHQNLSTVDESVLASEILGTEVEFAALRQKLSQMPCGEASYNGIIAPKIRLFRFPYGAYSNFALEFLKRHGFAAVQWDVAPGDPASGVTAGQLARDMERRAGPGSIIVLHANGRGISTAEALALFVPALKKRGYEFVSVGALLAAGKPEGE